MFNDKQTQEVQSMEASLRPKCVAAARETRSSREGKALEELHRGEQYEATETIVAAPLKAMLSASLYGLFCRFIDKKGPFKMYASLDAADAVNDNDILESNQMKYVSRQLYEETTGAGWKYNNVHFRTIFILNLGPLIIRD
ncbi:hypothetical protein N0V90_002596 [Kalmusia sp. IMI 367209]|nr:hypothetical protein N0V90_002596 [Kalmusia sp. IMI 367209]